MKTNRNIITYALELSDVSFSEYIFTPVDCLIFSQLSYLSFDGLVGGYQDNGLSIKIKDLKKHQEDPFLYHGIIMGKETKELLDVLIKSKRYGNVKVNFYENHFDEKLMKQFAAVTFMINDHLTYVSFRGTDETFIGWKEDFDMTFLSPIPAQVEAMKYVNAIGNLTAGELIVSGHSKGGNLAVFAALNANEDIQNKIVKVYNHDGPGFQKEIFESPLYLKMKDRIQTILPHSSVVGMLFQQQDEYLVVESHRFWVMQHDPFSWVVDQYDFKYIDEISSGAKLLSKSLNEWLNSIEHEKRQLFVETLFTLLDSTGNKDITNLSGDMLKNCVSMLNAIKELDKDIRHFCMELIISLFTLTAQSIKDEKLATLTQKLCLENVSLEIPEKVVKTIKNKKN